MDNEITIADRTWELKPLRGLKSIRLMPKVISIISEVIYAASKGGVPIDKWLLKGEQAEIGFDSAIQAVHFISNALGKRYAEFEREIVPFLLQQDYKWLLNNGSIGELMNGLWIAVKYHFESSFGEDTIVALKNSVTVPEEKEEAQAKQT